MTALKRKALQLVEQLPEEQMPYVIRYINTLNGSFLKAGPVSGNKCELTPKMKAFIELEQMLVPANEELDYDKELADFIVTRNTADFRCSKVKAITPREFLEVLENL